MADEFKSVTKEKIFRDTLTEADDLSIREQLAGYTSAVRVIETAISWTAAYHLIVLKPEERRVIVTPFSSGQLSQANERYAEIEKTISDGAPFQAVLVSAGPIAQLQRAYPNCFLDTRSFIDQLDALEQNI